MHGRLGCGASWVLSDASGLPITGGQVLGGLVAQAAQPLQELHWRQSFVDAHEAVLRTFVARLVVLWALGVTERAADGVVASLTRLHLAVVVVAAGARVTSRRLQLPNLAETTRVQGRRIGGITRNNLQCNVVGRGLG